MTTHATFDGWELALGGADGENVWSTAPGTDDGLLVETLDDALPTARSLLVHRVDVSKRALAALLAQGHEELAFLDCAIGGAFEKCAARRLWIRTREKLSVKALTPLGRASGLELLHLDGCAPASLFRWLAPLKTLRRLDLSRPDDDRDVGRGIAALGTLAALEQLGLRRAHVTESALAQLAALPALVRLDLSYAALSAPPRAWRGLARLEQLRLRGVRGLYPDLLAEIGRLGALRVLDLRGDPLDAGAIAPLQAALPQARVLFDPIVPRENRPAAVPPHPAPAPSAWPVPPLPNEPRRFPEDAPAIEDLYTVFPDERGSPCGFDKRFDLAQTATRFLPQQLIAALDPAANASIAQLVAALTMLPIALTHFDPNAQRISTDAIAATRALLGDPRTLDWQWAGPNQVYEFSVGGLAMSALLGALAWRAQRRNVPLADDLPLLHEVLDAELRRENGAPHAVAAHLFDRARDPGIDAAIAAWLGWLVATLDDADAPPRARIAALERLAHDHERVPAAQRAAAAATWRRALESLARHAVAPETEMRFRRAARKLVAARAPELFDAMRARGEVASRALPEFARLADGIGQPDPARVLPFAPDIDGATCIAALESDDLGAWFAALAFAPYCGDAAEARAIAPLAARLIGRSEQLMLEGAPCDRSTRLGDAAAAALVALLRTRGVPPDGLFELALDAASRAPLEPSLVTPAGASAALQATAPEARLVQQFLDRNAPAAQRFLMLLVCWTIRRDHAQRVLEDVGEDGDLRALIGCLSGLAQPAGAAPVPLCEPYAGVSIDNLRASLALGRHPVSVRRATHVLVTRLLPWDDQTALRAGAEALRAIPCPPALREIVDAPSAMGRLAAARWLAVLGAHADEARIARVMVEEGGWTARRPQGDVPRTPLQRMMAALVNETVVDHCDSDFDPLLVLGFGTEGAARIRAKAYAMIAWRHLDAGRVPFARRSTDFAAALDPLSFDVARLRRALS